MSKIKSLIKYLICAAVYDIGVPIAVIILGVAFNVIFSSFGGEPNNAVIKNISVIITDIAAISILLKLIKKYQGNDFETPKIEVKKTISIVLFFLTYPIVFFILMRYTVNMNSADNMEYGEPMGVIQFISAIAATALLTPVAEELLNRKLCFIMLDKFKPWSRILISMAVFILPHFVNSVTVLNFIFGVLVITLIYFKTNNIYYSVICHCSYNLSNVIINKLHSDRLLPSCSGIPYFPRYAEIISSVVFVLSAAYVFYGIFYKNLEKSVHEQK
ncbi:MAG: CPBP family glutamic-type intramembrane protease [Ruminococcus sp.]|nr:CPBP family glutamic-type intramembrane protease [Ruminococcus sp.]MCM1380458.1 CPBP family glutamic-type intramembrane protease [Muribaculaceae bacterium]MCM1479621.1 CPBP family glutamic-type intramembrane protease [Muribaculaceae bacterium]